MIYLFSFEGLREIEESRYRLPRKLIVQSFEERFLLQGRMEYLFEQPEDYEIFSGDIDRIVLEKWRPVMEDVLYDMEETPRLVFFAESDRRLFLSMKKQVPYAYRGMGLLFFRNRCCSWRIWRKQE